MLKLALRQPQTAVRDVAARSELTAAMQFMDGVAAGRLGPVELARWLDVHLVAAGRIARRPTVIEAHATVGVLELHGSPTPRAVRILPALVALAREHILVALRGLPADDTFLLRAIHTGRVLRAPRSAGGGWIARPREGDHLSQIVLCLFTADALCNRVEYDRSLYICGTCGRVWLGDEADRAACEQWPWTGSGVRCTPRARPVEEPTPAR